VYVCVSECMHGLYYVYIMYQTLLMSVLFVLAQTSTQAVTITEFSIFQIMFLWSENTQAPLRATQGRCPSPATLLRHRGIRGPTPGSDWRTPAGNSCWGAQSESLMSPIGLPRDVCQCIWRSRLKQHRDYLAEWRRATWSQAYATPPEIT
jgi:hypothetical protein